MNAVSGSNTIAVSAIFRNRARHQQRRTREATKEAAADASQLYTHAVKHREVRIALHMPFTDAQVIKNMKKQKTL